MPLLDSPEQALGTSPFHAQIRPGRHQPGTGKQPIAEFLADLDALGYEGAVGLEYRPQGSTEESLGWLPREKRG